MADLVEVAAVRVKGGKVDRPLVDLRQPGPPHLRQPDARHHRQGRQGRPEPGRSRQAGPRLRRRRDDRRPLRRLRHRLPRGRPRRRDADREGPLPRHPDPGPRRLPGPPELHPRRALEVLRDRAAAGPSRPAGRGGHGRAAPCDRRRAAGAPRRARGRHRRLDPRPADLEGRGQGPARRRASSGPREQGPLRPGPQEDRPEADPRRGHPDGRPRRRRDPPDHGGGRPRAARPRLRPLHPRRDAGPDRRHPWPVLGCPADRHDQPRPWRSATSTTTTCRRTPPARTR